MIPAMTAFQSSPDRGRGPARNMRVRRALEEVGQPYDVHPLSFEAMKKPAHLALHRRPSPNPWPMIRETTILARFNINSRRRGRSGRMHAHGQGAWSDRRCSQPL
jgi:hypothetical protein